MKPLDFGLHSPLVMLGQTHILHGWSIYLRDWTILGAVLGYRKRWWDFFDFVSWWTCLTTYRTAAYLLVKTCKNSGWTCKVSLKTIQRLVHLVVPLPWSRSPTLPYTSTFQDEALRDHRAFLPRKKAWVKQEPAASKPWGPRSQEFGGCPVSYSWVVFLCVLFQELHRSWSVPNHFSSKTNLTSGEPGPVNFFQAVPKLRPKSW